VFRYLDEKLLHGAQLQYIHDADECSQFHCFLWLKGYSMVLIREPEAAEVVYRNEGLYPSRIKTMEENLGWLYKKIHLPVPFAFLYAS